MCFLVTGSYQFLVAISGQLFKHDFSQNLKCEYRRIQFVFGCCSKNTSWNPSYTRMLLCADFSGKLGLYSGAF